MVMGKECSIGDTVGGILVSCVWCQMGASFIRMIARWVIWGLVTGLYVCIHTSMLLYILLFILVYYYIVVVV